MKILVACEESQRVCNAFRKKGHEAYSCDIIPTSGDHPEWHIQKDVSEILTNIVEPGFIDSTGHSLGASSMYALDENGKILSWNNPMTAKIRSKTFQGVADAMAEQWG